MFVLGGGNETIACLEDFPSAKVMVHLNFLRIKSSTIMI